MRIKIDDIRSKFDNKKDFFKYLKENKKDLIKQKKSLPITSADIAVRLDAAKMFEGITAEALMFKFEPMRNWNEKVYELYKDDSINQHSIGLQYVNIELAINDPDMKEEYAVWEKFYNQIINKEEAEKEGFFWAVRESKIYENSAVLWGANKMTPVLKKEMQGEKMIIDAVGNLANFMDTHMDVMIAGNWNKSIEEKGNTIPILHDHLHTVSARIGKTIDVYTQNVSVSELAKLTMAKKEMKRPKPKANIYQFAAK